MRTIHFSFLLLLVFFACKNSSSPEASPEVNVLSTLVADYDNFLQHWKQNTDTEIHRDKSGASHEHVHIKIAAKENNAFDLTFFTGRNNEKRIGQKTVQIVMDGKNQGEDVIALHHNGKRYVNGDGSFQMNGDTIWTDGMGILPAQKENLYRLIKVRYFAGWIDIPHPTIPDSTYRTGNLRIHDQGGMAQLDFPGIDYTAELTQLEFAHTIKIMKLAIYDTPMDQVGINSRSISYTWTSIAAKRLGINLRKLISGWTLIEEGYINSENLNKK